MLALRPFIALLAFVLVPLASFIILAQAPEPEIWRFVIVGVFALVTLGLFRGAVWRPWRALRAWRAYANAHGYEFKGDLSHEPVVTGARDGRPFVAGVSAHIAPSGPDRYRTLVSSPVEHGVPLGLRVYVRSDPTWVYELSGQREIATGDATLHERFCIEGYDGEAVRDYVLNAERGRALLNFAQDFVGLLVHGADSDELPAEPGGASGLVTLAVPGRILDPDEIHRLVDAVCGLAHELEIPPSG